ncbi:MAG: hypothetical protein ACE5JQ_02985 [Candidatus Methylomirabilales bacterium]
MVPGFNTNLSWHKQTYHIQTEDLDRGDPHILTVAYQGGAVVIRIKTHYGELLGPDPSPQAVRALMARQHRQVITDIQAGKVEGTAGR